jgi:AraC-like DNA-binding protein
MNETSSHVQSEQFHVVESPLCVSHGILIKNFPSHSHDFIELEFIASGCGTEIINGIEYKVKRGSLSVLLPWHVHKILLEQDNPLEIFKCSFGSDLFLNDKTPFFDLGDIVFRNMTSLPVVDFDPTNCEKVISLFNELLQEYANVKPWKDTIIKAKISEILVYFDRCRNTIELSEVRNTIGQGDVNIWKVIEFIHESYNKEITISDASKLFHYSESHLNKLLKQSVGLSFNEIIQEVRIRNACSYLKYPMVTVGEIALYVGYKSQEAFYAAFKNVKGISPENYRKLIHSYKDSNNKRNIHSVLNAQIVYYLHLHYSENITLSSLAKKFKYNESYLSNELSQNGVNFISLLHEIRVYHACALLITTDMSINEIGFSVGFDSSETFFRVFKNLRGESPREYRKKYEQKS